ncbi:CDP-alcohol phosphatidyltransferase [Collinsella sp. zg1085]|uniref:CDP-alcohol phosphatidyltransferase n=1 Tax=Collinsella sp. zg1085 TaxID=2844380 RepID=UPI001C0C7455|nr:CDP-alcohol phosphatidyltransferase [Collinsella sp. zg1085]QWT17749.1 CDP-alcohol phosphatidyltransferase [Collinsella sp. zg1085]
MGVKADETLTVNFEELLAYLRSKTRVFMTVEGHEYYVTHTDGYWRVQDCEELNEKGRFTDCSELVTTLSELVELPWLDGKSLHDLADSASFYESIQEGWICPA